MCRKDQRYQPRSFRHMVYSATTNLCPATTSAHTTLLLFILPVLFVLTCPYQLLGNQLPIYSSNGETDTPENWNSHIDNQAYLERLRKKRDEQSSTPPHIIHIDRSRGAGSETTRSRESWEVEYSTPGYTFIYRENYRRHDGQITIIRPLPKQKKKKQPRGRPSPAPE